MSCRVSDTCKTRHELLKHKHDTNYKTCLYSKHEHDTFNIRVTRDATRLTRKFNPCYTMTRRHEWHDMTCLTRLNTNNWASTCYTCYPCLYVLSVYTCLYVLSVYPCYTFFLNVFPVSYTCKNVSNTCKTRKHVLQIRVDMHKHEIRITKIHIQKNSYYFYIVLSYRI